MSKKKQQFDETRAKLVRLARAAFAERGYAEAATNELVAKAGMTRGALYYQFRDKRDLFLKSYQRYREEVVALFSAAFDPSFTLRQTLDRIFDIAIAFYTTGENGPRGCLTVMTAASEAMSDPKIREIAEDALVSADRVMQSRFTLAKERGELSADADVTALAHLATAMLQTLAIRARAGAKPKDLRVLADGVIRLILPTGT